MSDNFRDLSTNEQTTNSFTTPEGIKVSYPNDGFASFFLISFCVSRKNNAYGETGLNSANDDQSSSFVALRLLLRFVRIFSFLLRLFLFLDDFASERVILAEKFFVLR